MCTRGGVIPLRIDAAMSIPEYVTAGIGVCVPGQHKQLRRLPQFLAWL